MFEPSSDGGRNVDYRSVSLGRPIAQFEQREGIQVDERDCHCHDDGRCPAALFAATFAHDHG